MRVVIRSAADPSREIDVTRILVAAIAQELWRTFRGNDVLNWIEAERHLESIVGIMRGMAIPERTSNGLTASPQAAAKAHRPSLSAPRLRKPTTARGGRASLSRIRVAITTPLATTGRKKRS